MRYKMDYRFFLDVRFKKGTDIKRVKQLERKGESISKHLNSRITSLYLAITFKGKYLKVNTAIKIKPKHFDVAEQKVLRSHEDHTELNLLLGHIKSQVEIKHREFILSRPNISTRDIKNMMKQVVQGGGHNKNERDFFLLFDKFIQEIEKVYKRQTIKNYQTFRKLMSDFQRDCGFIDIHHIDIDFGFKLIIYCVNERGHVNNYIAKTVRNLKAFLNYCYDRGYISHNDFSKIVAKEEEIEIIYLTEKEVGQIISLDFTNNLRLDKVKDVFLFQIFTGQRFGDLNKLTLDKVKLIEGIYYWINHQGKGNKIIPVPIPLRLEAMEIVRKYEKKIPTTDIPLLPTCSLVKFNSYIKELCQKAGIDDVITITRNSGSNRLERTAPKYSFIRSHTARKTFITNNLVKGVPRDVVKKIVGHRKDKTMDAYFNAPINYIGQEYMKKQ
jgi:integrase